VKKYCRSGHEIDDKMTRALCMLNTKDPKHALRICNIYFYYNNGCTNAPQCYFTRILPVWSENEKPTLHVTDNKVLPRKVLGTIHMNDESGPYLYHSRKSAVCLSVRPLGLH
jgi:hypothetical protein